MAVTWKGMQHGVARNDQGVLDMGLTSLLSARFQHGRVAGLLYLSSEEAF
jgi:hypothetical protein